MADAKQHALDCLRLLEQPYAEVHRHLDSMFRQHGPFHRRYLHNAHTVRMLLEKQGKDAARAAIAHIVRDCGHVPRMRDYRTGAVDAFGCEQGDDGIVPGTFHVGLDVTVFAEYRAAVEAEWKRFGL
jgi:hypothetical protein